MEPRERMLLEVVAGILLVIFLVLASIMVVSAYKSPNTKITNSYNTYTYNNNVPSYPSIVRDSRSSAKPYFVDRSDYRSNDRVYYFDDSTNYADDRYLRYDDFGNFKTYTGVVGNRVNNYEVYVMNKDYAGGYFKTTFYFEDYYGSVDSESMTHYIPAREEKKFVLKDVSPSRYDHKRWGYEVKSLSKSPKTKTYYEDTPYIKMHSGYSYDY